MKNNISRESLLPKELFKLADCQAEVENDLLEKDNVVGVSIGERIKDGQLTGEKCLSVLVSHKLPPDLLSKNDCIDTSKKIEGNTVDVVEVGEMFAGEGGAYFEDLDFKVQEPTTEKAPAQKREEGAYDGILDSHILAFKSTLNRRVRPVEGGYSIGHYRITAGTMATACYDASDYGRVPDKYYALSNNHVLANSNNARVGDPILQPGRYDGGVYPRDVIARLSRWVPIKFHSGSSKPLNYVDAAIAEGDFQDLDREIYWVGYVQDRYSPPQVGERVLKTGRTTGFTTGTIKHINATVDVNYGSAGVARFSRQIVTSRMGAPGDSGSLILDEKNGAVGLLFAGSSTHTIANNIAYVQVLLGIRIAESNT